MLSSLIERLDSAKTKLEAVAKSIDGSKSRSEQLEMDSLREMVRRRACGDTRDVDGDETVHGLVRSSDDTRCYCCDRSHDFLCTDVRVRLAFSSSHPKTCYDARGEISLVLTFALTGNITLPSMESPLSVRILSFKEGWLCPSCVTELQKGL